MNPETSIRVISLADAQDRREAFARHIADAGLSWSFFDAHRQLASFLAYDEKDAWVARGRPLKPQELGCYSSHVSIWKEFLEGDAQQLCVLEDDVVADWEYLRRDVFSRDYNAAGIHLLRLYGRVPARCRLHAELDRIRLFQMLGYLEGTQAYIMTRHGAGALLKHCQRVMRPVDDEVDRSWIHGIHSFALLPYPAFELQMPTQISNREVFHGDNPYMVQRYRYRIEDKIRRLAHELKEYIPFLRTEIHLTK